MRHQRPSRARRKPCAERLEGRRLLSVFTVTNTDDSGDGSLRDAIERANARPGPDSIAFDLPGSGLRSITPGSALPTITDTLTIDGYTQDGASPNTQVNSDDAVILVALDGLKAGGGASGLTISANGCAVRGLAIRRFPGAGILVDDADGCVFQGNFIGGTTTADVDVLGNKLSGISLLNAADTLVGGDRPADRNVLDDNDLAGVAMSGAGSVRNTVAGNFLGLDVRGTGPVGNSFGVLINGGASFNTVGGVTPGARNVIADNGSGVTISFRDTTHNRVVGNFIGTDALGANSLQNTTGVFISDGSSDNVVGGPTAAERNVISGNFVGVLIKEVGGEANQAGGNFTTDNSVLGNYIGTDPAGLNPVRNIQYGVLLIGVHGTKIGGARPGMGNVISASVGGGVEIIGQTATGNLIQGNLIGTDATGLANADTLFAQATGTPGPLGNLGGGVIVNNAPGNLIGGTEPGAGNVISGNGLAGVQLFGPWATGNVIQGNKIGVDATGLAPLGNTPDGVQVNNAPGNLIGGTEPGARNVISANASEGVNVVGPGSQQNHIQGNTIGADLTGTNPLPNTLDGVFLNNAPGNVVGGNTPGARNVISGNGQTGVRVFNRLASDNQILGNFIGTDPTGAKPLPNGRAGVQIEAAGSNVIGGDGTGQGNLVSGNPVGVMLLGPAASGNLIVGNTVGTDATGTKPLGNGTGVMISGAAGNVVRADLVSGNQVGIQIAGQGASGNIVQGCTVGTDRAGALSVANGVGVLVSGASGNLIGGTSAGQGNLISGNTSAGFHVFDRFASGNVIAGNVVGLDRAGLRAVVGKNGRQQVGVLINQAPGNDLNERPGAGNLVGGTTPGARNLISGNATGVMIHGASAFNNRVLGNWIGPNARGLGGAGNGVGVYVTDARGNAIGQAGGGNVISGNTGVGVYLLGGGSAGSSTPGNTVAANTIGLDPTGTKPLPNQTGVYLGVSTGNTIGGAKAADGNVISANLEVGVYVVGPTPRPNVVMNNAIGTNASGSRVFGNRQYGVLLANAANTTVVRSGRGANRIAGSGIANFREYTGPLNAASGTRVAAKAARR